MERPSSPVPGMFCDRIRCCFWPFDRPPVVVRADVEVHVTQRSTRKTAVVEFSFDPRAVGPGCYVVD